MVIVGMILIFNRFAEKVILISNHFETGDVFYFDSISLFQHVILI